jgi:hypothetical protein
MVNNPAMMSVGATAVCFPLPAAPCHSFEHVYPDPTMVFSTFKGTFLVRDGRQTWPLNRLKAPRTRRKAKVGSTPHFDAAAGNSGVNPAII